MNASTLIVLEGRLSSDLDRGRERAMSFAACSLRFVSRSSFDILGFGLFHALLRFSMSFFSCSSVLKQKMFVIEPKR